MFVVFDLDGTLADIRHRVHHVRGSRPDWEAFFAECVHDLPNAPVVNALRAHVFAGDRVEIWSARSDIVRAQTEASVCARGIDPRLLSHMRAAGDNLPNVTVLDARNSAEPKVMTEQELLDGLDRVLGIAA